MVEKSVVLDPFQNIVAVGWGGPFALLLVAVAMQADESYNGWGPGTEGGGVLVTPELPPDYDVTFGEAEFKKWLFAPLADGGGPNDTSYTAGGIYLINVSKIFQTFGNFYAATNDNPRLRLYIPIASGDAPVSRPARLRSVVYGAGNYPALKTHIDNINATDFFGANHGASLDEMLDALMIPGGVVVNQFPILPQPLITTIDALAYDSPTPTIYEWSWDFFNRNFAPFAPPTIEATL